MNDNILDEIFAPLIDSPSLTLTTTYWKEAKRQIREFIEQQVLIGRIDELESFYTTSSEWIDRRLAELKAQLKEK
jgi:hypothetical protein